MQLVDVAITTDDDDSEEVTVNGGTLTPPDPVTPTAGGDTQSVAEISPTDGDIEELIVNGGSLTPPDPVTSPNEDEDTLSGADFFDVTMVNVLDSEKTLIEMARKDNEFHDLYRSNLHNLNNEHCALEDKSYCIGVFGTATSVSQGGHEGNTGIHGAVRLAPEWSAGMSIAYLADANLPGGIESRDSHTPGVGAYLRYAENPDATGLSVTASAAYQEQELSIRRTILGETEPGSGDSEMAGTLFALDGTYAVQLNDSTLLSSTVGVEQLQTHRDGYVETRNAEFPAVYGKSGEKSTALQVGMGLDHDLTRNFSVHADAGTRFVLDRDRDPFTVQANYIGGFVDDADEKVSVMPYANAGISARWGANDSSLARLRVGIAKSDYGNNDASVGFSYDYRF